MRHPLARAGLALTTAMGVALAASGCFAGSDSSSSGNENAPAANVAEGSQISDERCQKNKDAGKIVYLTGYQYQASASILEYIAADKLGYFKALCLDVEIQPGTGDSMGNARMVAAGQVQVTPISLQEIIGARVEGEGSKIVGISAYSSSGLDVLMTNKDVNNLTQLEGKILGHKGKVPTSVEAMLKKAGVKYDAVQQVKVGYDATVLPRGEVQALTGFISNEPNQLAAQNKDVTVWRPFTFGIPSSIGGMAANPDFVTKHPTAAQDFMRAGFHAYEYCADDAKVSECVGYATEAAGGASDAYDPKHQEKIWKTEVAEIEATRTKTVALGALDLGHISSLVTFLKEANAMPASVTEETAKTYFDTSVVEGLYDADQLIWPAP
ncbi:MULTISPECIES: ABC transporter substrate-binding protein [Actinosynnema]|uniref:Thiamine pyrimidine synthase n=1 Tax=Actinosynnema pretiosum TaxID=42197 RepID=A0A290Z576_9PSEU|nr:ABC transporter substrate-binding protein [Actinosynnema pretiosum]ATE54148.1 thiamine biosynthesis protein [Actinosynnema pretiosum]